MIRTEVVRNKDGIDSIFISGHSGYEEIGKDIVCSAVSTAMYVSIGLLEKIDCEYRFVTDDKSPTMRLEMKKQNQFSHLILENLIETLKGIANDYSNYLKIIEIRR